MNGDHDNRPSREQPLVTPTEPSGIPRTRDRILVTGGGGAVGRCVLRELLAETEAELVVLVRSPASLPAQLLHHSRVTMCIGDVAHGGALAERLPTVDRAVLLATSWGADAEAVNLDGTTALSAALATRGARQIIWFGTASVLLRDGTADPAAVQHGTPYVRTKALCRAHLLKQHTQGLTIVHPTLVVAADAGLPASHLTRLLHEIDRHVWLAQYVRGEGSCHLVHATDLARLVRQLVTTAPHDAPRELIAGAPAVTLDELLDLLLARAARRRRAALDLTPGRIEWLIRRFAVQLSEWDRHCLAARHFTYRDALLTLAPSDPPRFATARDILNAVAHRHS